MPNSTCAVSSCDRSPSSGKRYCSGHDARLHRLGDVQADKPLRKRKPGTPRDAAGMPECSVDGCTKPARSKSSELCGMHYHRIYRGTPLGDASQRRRGKKNPECLVDGCFNPDSSSGYCSMHATRISRHGDPNVVIASKDRALPEGEAHPNWVGDEVGYTGAHHRVRRRKGPASAHQCVSCRAPAEHWSYDHSDPDEKFAVMGGYEIAYSTVIDHYHPRCVPCHKRYDLDRADSTIFGFSAMALT